MLKEKTFGICLVCVGHPYYGRMGLNLAISVKAVERDCPIAVLYSGAALNHLNDHQKEYFDYIIPLGEEVMGGVSSKLYAHKYTPFDCTLLLDADMLWLPKQKPSDLFNELKDVQFTGITEGCEENPHPKYYFWADLDEIKKVYKPKGKLYQWRSEVLYFTKKGAKVFDKAIEIVKNPQLKSIKNFAYKPPDELGINIATALADIHPHVMKWQPSFWHLMNGGYVPDLMSLSVKYWLISFGSNMASGTLKKIYDKIVKAACYKLGIQHVFSLSSKRDWDKTRDRM